eukprot:761042-Hanusia_phi.AAC.7
MPTTSTWVSFRLWIPLAPMSNFALSSHESEAAECVSEVPAVCLQRKSHCQCVRDPACLLRTSETQNVGLKLTCLLVFGALLSRLMASKPGSGSGSADLTGSPTACEGSTLRRLPEQTKLRVVTDVGTKLTCWVLNYDQSLYSWSDPDRSIRFLLLLW